jgi:hypothetical protein
MTRSTRAHARSVLEGRGLAGGRDSRPGSRERQSIPAMTRVMPYGRSDRSAKMTFAGRSARRRRYHGYQ